jgi:uncharacterized protein (DUF2252 family)
MKKSRSSKLQRRDVFKTRKERANEGKALRDKFPRKSHGDYKLPRNQRDPIQILEKSNAGRVPELVPIRFGRMLQSPFTFLRGSAAVMAYDLARTPATGMKVQACGDCHLLNFGLFATPERNLVFDLNDFDETHPAPWEWDLKRLVASFVVAARDARLSEKDARGVVLNCVDKYREHMRECSTMTPMEVWYECLDSNTLIELSPDAKTRKFRENIAKQARKRIVEHLFPKIVETSGGKYRLVDQPPILYHPESSDWAERVQLGLSDYRDSLPHDRQVLLNRYRIEDAALKVVGIGSVGTHCYIGLLMSDDDRPLMLQFKQANRSVLEPYTEKSKYENQGERVVIGQRLMQSSSDIFLGWARGSKHGRDFFVRQLRDMKMSIPVGTLKATALGRFAQACGWTLARAHAKSGDAAAITGYLGKGDSFDKALAKFAVAYADQTERDYDVLVKAARSGRVEVLVEE